MADLRKLQSVFGVVRSAGVDVTTAWTTHALFVAAVAVSLVWLERSKEPPTLGAAAIGLSALLANPYIYVYDLVALAVPTAFLARAGFDRAEAVTLLALGAALGLSMPFQTPAGLIATFGVGALIVRRALQLRPEARPRQL